MGTYVQLDCINCQESLKFGKPISHGGILTLRLFSEKAADWRDDVSCWNAIEVFFFRHENHPLVFRRDDTPDAQDIENTIELDQLLDLRENDATGKYYFANSRA
jgi:hypothetical protein